MFVDVTDPCGTRQPDQTSNTSVGRSETREQAVEAFRACVATARAGTGPDLAQGDEALT